jgi:hypothetical protein
MGFSKINHILKNIKPTEFGDIISQKLQTIWFTLLHNI